jgi:hypothetical protein
MFSLTVSLSTLAHRKSRADLIVEMLKVNAFAARAFEVWISRESQYGHSDRT